MKMEDAGMTKRDYIFAAIHILSIKLQVLGDKIDPTISSKQWFVLAVVWRLKEIPPNIGDVANALGTSRQNIKKMANILQRRGFLRMEKNKDDLRNIQLFLTEQCKEYFENREQLENNYIESVFSGMDDELLSALYNGMSKLLDNVEKLLEGDADAERTKT